MARIVVVGGFGWIGLHLARILSPDHEVIVVDPRKLTEDEKDFLSKQNFEWIHSYLMPMLFREGKVCRDADVIISLPGQLGSVPSISRPFDSLTQSVMPHLSLLTTLARDKLKPLVIFPSSDLVYCKPPRCLYTAHKLTVESYLRVFNRIYGIPFISLRMGTGYGPWQRRDSVVNFYVRQGLAGEEIPVYGDGLNRQAFVYIDDAVECFKMACEGKFSVNSFYSLVGHNSRIVDVAEVVVEHVGGIAKHVEWPELAKAVSVGDLPVEGDGAPGWKAQVGLVEGVLRTAEWMRK